MSVCKRLLFLLALACCVIGASLMPMVQAEEVNLAQGKTYSLFPNPSYHLCTDPGDKVQLTDGQTTQSYFWTQMGTVGWQHVPYSLITVDLGKIEPISRFEFTTAARAGGVEWPHAVFVQLSDDGKTFRQVCDLVDDDLTLKGEFSEKYAIRCLTSKPIATKGRFVRFMVLGSGTFIFCDEVRVFQGDPANLDKPTGGEAISTPDQIYKTRKTELCVQKRYRDDEFAIRKAIAHSSVSEDLKTELNQEIDAVLANQKATIAKLSSDFRTILPLDENHGKLYAIQAKLWSAQGVKPLTVTAEPDIWSPLDRFTVPVISQSDIQIAAMRNETRHGAFNLYNSTDKMREVQFLFNGKLTDEAEVTVYQVDWTDTAINTPTASALTELQPKNKVYSVSVYPGLVRQIWISVKPTGTAGQTQKRELSASICFGGSVQSGLASIPVRVTVYPFDFPDKTKLLVGGWDYTNNKIAYNVTSVNKKSFLEHMKSRGVNCPWGSPSLLSAFEVGKDLSVQIDPSEFDAWAQDWSGSAEYAIFLAKGGWSSKAAGGLKGYAFDSPEFKTVVANWIQGWAKHWNSLGIESRKVHLLIYDEPNDSTPDEAIAGIVKWAEAIKSGCPEVNIWVDPCYRDFKKAANPMIAASDVLCPNRPMWLDNRKAFDAFYLGPQVKGKTLHLYSCSGPARLLDPYAYYRLQAWEAARIGAKASFFWAMGDGGGVSSWNEYFLGRNAYCPIFIDPNDPVVTGAKQMEGITDGARDFEYIDMLKGKIARLEKENPDRASKLAKDLNALIESVLYAENADKINWLDRKDSTQADKARVQILDWLSE